MHEVVDAGHALVEVFRHVGHGEPLAHEGVELGGDRVSGDRGVGGSGAHGRQPTWPPTGPAHRAPDGIDLSMVTKITFR